jgi:hypothetical protein
LLFSPVTTSKYRYTISNYKKSVYFKILSSSLFTGNSTTPHNIISGGESAVKSHTYLVVVVVVVVV